MIYIIRGDLFNEAWISISANKISNYGNWLIEIANRIGHASGLHTRKSMTYATFNRHTPVYYGKSERGVIMRAIKMGWAYYSKV